MSIKELEQRILALEDQVRELQRTRPAAGKRTYNWEATVKKFKNDEHVLSVLSEAMKAREKERKSVRKSRSSRPKKL